MKKKMLIIFLCVLMIGSFLFTGSAAEVVNEKEYPPLDLVVVMDTSGSMKESDRDYTAPAAVRMLVNMMPAEDSRVGIVSFNRQAKVLTTDPSGAGILVPLKEYTGLETVRTQISDVSYVGGTGIGNALFAATQLLQKNSSDEHAKAIILFTDGVNDFGYDVFARTECDSNEVSALQWAEENDCCVYCVGYDYIMSDGKSSMGENGEGLLKLENIADGTNGKFKAIHNIKEIEQLLIEFLADVCDLNYTTIATIPGDGGYHECPIAISPSVVEANIRIAGGAENALANGELHLYDPSGAEIELRNEGNVRFDKDATAVSIKVIMPTPGDWLLTVKGVSGDEIHVGLLEHFKMNLTSQLVFPENNPEGIAYAGDTIGIKAWLTYDGVALEKEDLYTGVTSATALCVSRANPDDKKLVTLTRDGFSFAGSFEIPEDCYYDITVRLEWNTVYRENTLTVGSTNPPIRKIGELKDMRVNKNKTVAVNDIFSIVQDDEMDKITASLYSMSAYDVADVSVVGSDLVITGKKWSSTLVTIEFRDVQGNTEYSSFKLHVFDPVAFAMIIVGIVLLAAGILAGLYFAYKKTLRIKGNLITKSIRVCDNTKEPSFIQELNFNDDKVGPVVSMTRNYLKNRSYRQIQGIISAAMNAYETFEPGTPERELYEHIQNNAGSRQLKRGSDKVRLTGSPLGNSFVVGSPKRAPFLYVNKMKKGRVTVKADDELTVLFKEADQNGRQAKRTIEFRFVFRSNVRAPRNRGGRRR